MQTGRVPQIPPLAVPQLAQPSQPLLREQDTSDLGQLPEPIQQSQPIQQPANPLPPSFEPKPITAEISLIADPATGRCADDVMICLFGGLGAMARYVLDVSIQRGWNRENRRTNRNFPLSTLVINGVASLCAGIA